jgi:glycosyltransferase involved in cell wall biosynthesis
VHKNVHALINKPKRIVCFGPGPAFKGGISNYNSSLALALEKAGAEVIIVSWTQQYPAIIPRDFIDKKSRVDLFEHSSIPIHYTCNYNNPITWAQTVKLIQSLEPDIVIIQWAITIQGLPLSWIASKLAKSKDIEVIFDCHVVIQKEESSLDKFLSRKALKYAHTYIVHSYTAIEELKTVFPEKKFEVSEDGRRIGSAPIIKLFHPVYDLFTPRADFDIDQAKDNMGLRKHVLLCFGFIRKYKGLHQTIEAFAHLTKRRDDVSLLIVGESFWDTLKSDHWATKLKKNLFEAAKKVFLKQTDNEQDYRPLSLIPHFGLEDRVVVVNEFVPNEAVYRYYQVSDYLVLFYLKATLSGVESIANNFEIPVLATKVGHFTETIRHGYNGYLADDQDIEDMARVMEYALDHPIPKDHIREASQRLSWDNYAQAILFKTK